MRRLTYFSVVLLLLLAGCDDPMSLEQEAGIDGVVSQVGPPEDKGGGHTSVGNNLSFPVIFSDGVTITLRGTEGDTTYQGATFVVDGLTYWKQADPGNEWRAASLSKSATASVPSVVDEIDWGDNLESRDWPAGSKVRVETVLYDTLARESFDPMTAYRMVWDPSSGTGKTEMWGSDKTTYLSEYATFYSGRARLVIQKIDVGTDGAPIDPGGLQWDAATLRWTNAGFDGEGNPLPNTVPEPNFTSGVYEDNPDGPGAYSAEINVKGKVIYGYNWDTRTTASGPGEYRLTFVLVPDASLNTFFVDGTTRIQQPVEEAIIQAEPAGNTGIVRSDLNLTYIDVGLTARGGGRK